MALGLCVGSVRVWQGPTYMNSTARTLSQPLFEAGVISTPGSVFHLTDILVHPVDGNNTYWITGRYHESSELPEGRNEDFKFPAPTPYVPRLAMDIPDKSTFTVRSYLDQLSARVPGARLTYRYAWYEQPLCQILLAAVIGMVFGVTGLPTAVRVLLPGLLCEEETDREIIESESSDQSIAPVATPAEVAVAPEVGIASPAVNKHYGGEFYPTEVHSLDL